MERGVGGREITILRETGEKTQSVEKEDEVKPNEAEKDGDRRNEAEKDSASSNGYPDGSKNSDGVVRDETTEATPQTSSKDSQPAAPFHRDIIFEDELESAIGPTQDITNEERVPTQLDKEKHIEFVKNQRNPQDNAVLRIPGPRDVERGDIPERIERDEEGNPIRRPSSAGHSDFQVNPDSPELSNSRHINFSNEDESHQMTRHRLGKFHMPQIGQERGSAPPSLQNRAQSFTSIIGRSLSQRRDSDPHPYLSYEATIGRNSMFVDLTEEQREELGGVEYRSLKTLAWVLIIYNTGFTLLGIVILLPWILLSTKYRPVVEAVSQSPAWWGIFTPVSMFTDLGFTLTPDSMISFQTATLPLVLGSFLIIIGNTGFPCMLRFLIWIGTKVIPTDTGIWEELRFLMNHPRRCFTLLFPRKATWWLFTVLVALNAIDLIFFVILDLHDPVVTSLPPVFRFLDGLFQAASTRTAGFACVNLAELHPGIQVSYLVMMYISVLPIAISVRQTNVYEERSLGIYKSTTDEGPDEEADPRSYLGSHLRRQLSFDLWYVFLGLFFICIIEGSRIQDSTQPQFTIFSVLFEIISAYGTVGLSLGYPGTNASFSAQFRPLSKLIIVAMMLRGRHRGLPYALDRAVLLPGEGLKKDKRRAAEADLAAEEYLAQTGTVGPNGILGAGATGSNNDGGVDRRTTKPRRQSDGTTQDRRVRRGSQGRNFGNRVNLANIVAGALSAGPAGGLKEKRG